MILSIPILKQSEEADTSSAGKTTKQKASIDFEGSLQRFLTQERLAEADKIKCDFCKQNTTVLKHTELCTLPQVLIV